MSRPQFLPGVLAVCLTVCLIANLYVQNAPAIGLAVAVAAVCLLLACRAAAPALDRLRHPGRLLAAGFALMLLGQIAVLHFLPVTVYHDPFRVLAQAAKMAAGDRSWTITYFWRYPNNVSLAYFLSWWLRGTNLLGWSTNLSLQVLSLALLDGFIALLLRTLRRLAPRPSTTFFAAGFLMLTPFAYTYFLQVFYSDLPAMLLLLALFALLRAWPRGNRWGIGFGLVVCAALAMLLKPNLIVLVPALLLVALIRRPTWQKMLPAALIVLGLGLSVPAKTLVYQQSDFHQNARFELPATSWMLMGLNEQSAGKYSGKDVAHAIGLGSKQRVQAYDRKASVAHAQKLGVAGLLRLWLAKLGLFQRVAGIQNWYNGGFRAAPRWYLSHAGYWSALCALSYQVATVALLLSLLPRLWRWRVGGAQTQSLLLLATVVILGLMAFHTLLWEVEARYGQLTLPLLWVLAAGLPHPVRTVHRRAWPLLAAAALSLVLGAWGQAALHTQPLVVAAQRSQLSTQYHAAPHALAPGARLQQAVTLNARANYFSVQVHAGSDVAVTLKTAGGRVYRLHPAGSVYRLHHALAPGTYTIAVRNAAARPQSVDVVRATDYRLAAYPLWQNGRRLTDASLIYTCLFK